MSVEDHREPVGPSQSCEDLSDHARRKAFLTDLSDRWRPSSRADRLLERRSRVVHLIDRVVGADGSLVPAALGLGLITGGFALLALAESKSNDPYGQIAPLWVGLALVSTLVMAAVEFYRSGNQIRARHFATRAGFPLAVSAGLMAALTRPVTAADVWGRWAVAALALAMAGMSIAALRSSARWFHRFGSLLSVSSVVLALSLGAWTGIYASGASWLWALGSAIIAVGSARLAFGMWQAHPTLVR
ncbi:MAG: hypothetical protein AB7L13_11500 [Acidimicrobiia bacterium]